MNSDVLNLPSNLSLQATRCGKTGPTVLLIHGWTCRGSDWTETMKSLCDEFQFTAIDLPGHGESRYQTMDDWSVKGMAEVVADVARSLSGYPVVLVGHSMGGAVALEAARLLEQVSGIVLVDTFVIPYGDLTEDQAREIEQPFFDDFGSAIDGLVENFTAPDVGEKNKQRMKAEMTAVDPEKMLPLWSDLLRWSPGAAFDQLKMPIAAINGDMISDAARSRCLSYVKEHHLDGAGHFPHVEMPERFHGFLRNVLKDMG